jgi:hypothetical protein
MEIVRDDAEDALLLAVFPLPTPEAVAADGASHLPVTLEGGQMIALTVGLDEGPMVRRARICCSSPTRSSSSRRTRMSHADHMGNRTPRTLTDCFIASCGSDHIWYQKSGRHLPIPSRPVATVSAVTTKVTQHSSELVV